MLRGSPPSTARPVPICPPGYTLSPGYGCIGPSSSDYTEGWPGYDYWPDYGYGYPFGGFPGFGFGAGRFHRFAGFHGGGFHGGFAGHGGNWRGGRYGWGGGLGLGLGWGLGYPYDWSYYPPDYGYYGYSQPYSASQYWYYCSNPAGYYPYVTQCNTGWQTVPAS